METQFEWLGDSKRLVAVFVPAKRAPMPQISSVASSPLVKVSDDKATAMRTYAGLMNSPHEFDLLEWHATGQLGVASIESGKVSEIGKPAMIENVSPQADGSHFRVTLMERPFSYLVTTGSFPEREVIWNAEGKQIVELAKRPLRFGVTPPATPPTPSDSEKRSIAWRPDGQGFSFLQLTSPPRREGTPADPPSEDEQGRGGGQGRGAGQAGAAGLRPGQKDRVMQWVAPYGEKDVKAVYESDQRIGNVQYSDDCKTIFVTQTIAGRSRVSAVKLDSPTKAMTIVESATGDNAFYEDAGSLVTKEGSVTGSVVRMSSDGKFVYLGGTKYFRDPTKDAPRAFLDRVEIETGKKERIFEADPNRSESISMLDDDAKQALVVRQSPTSISQTHLVDLGAKKETQLTANRDYAPDLTQATQRKYTVTRNDGLKFQVEVTLPAGTRPGAKVPAFFWFYPSEFVDQAAYDRGKRTFNKNTFSNVSPSNKVLLLRAGYALVEPDCPIIGPETRKNDGYIPQLRNNLAATIDAICEDGTIDRNKLGIGGHSYGAFSTLNAMVHTPFFKAGIAGDGNYNRLLTPFGFQGEQRQLWESREVYLSMSPMLYLEQLTGAVLLYHGIDDQNMGTDPINSPKMFAALEALGKNAALYMYPYEDHGQIAEETVLDQWARFVAWLDKYVKNGGK
ncbi:MAG: S9 family peptidase [Chlorobia bacterium]|nr:S9 family peptidase [Fimbriimonadaceae bacterium]